MGGGGGTDVDLSHRAVAAMSSGMAEGLRPVVLQVADTPRLALRTAPQQRYRLLLSDGVHAQHGALATALNHLVWDGSLRRGTVVRVLDYTCSVAQGMRIILLIQLEILPTDCTMIGCPTMYEVTPTQHYGVSCSGGVVYHEPAQRVTGNLSYFGQGMLDSSLAPRAEHASHNLSYGGCYGSVLPQNTVDAKMQLLSLDDHQKQKFQVQSETFGLGSTSRSSLSPSYLVQSAMSRHRSSVAMSVYSITALNPYQTRWTIKARVTAKTDLRLYNNACGHGKVFSFDLLDAQGGEIRATCFNLQAERYFDLIEVERVLLVSGGKLKFADKKYNTLNGDLELFVDDSTSIEICSDNDSIIPNQQYNFRQISEIENMEIRSLVDLLGVVTLVSSSVTLTRKDGTEAQKRTLQLEDMSNRSVEVTLLGKFCDREGQKLQRLYDSGSNPILAVKNCRISDISGRSLVTVSTTQLKVNPDFPEAERLRQWYLSEGKTDACVSLSRRTSSMTENVVSKTIAQIKDEKLGYSYQPDLITVRATISHVNADNFCYTACTLDRNCKQCMTRNSDGTWYCDRCSLNLPKCENRYLLRCQLQDHTGFTYATAFEEAGTKIIGYSSEELLILRDSDEAKWKEIMLGVCWQKYLFKLKITEDTFHGVSRVRCNIVDAEKLDASATCHRLLEELQTAPGYWARKCPVSST